MCWFFCVLFFGVGFPIWCWARGDLFGDWGDSALAWSMVFCLRIVRGAHFGVFLICLVFIEWCFSAGPTKKSRLLQC